MSASATFLERLYSLQGKAALITGASGGIGRELATGLAEAGARVAVHGRNADEVAASCAAVAERGGDAIPLRADIGTVDECRRLVSEAIDGLGRLDILINCAATNQRMPIADVSEEDYDRIMAVNLKSVYFLSQAAHAQMAEQGGGKIIHIGSINQFYGLDTVSVYGASKGGVGQLTKVMAVEWARDNVQVNCVVPGFIHTPLTAPLWADEEKASWFRSRLPTRRPGQPQELVGATIFLASSASNYVTGQNLVIDGGFTAGGSWLQDSAADAR